MLFILFLLCGALYTDLLANTAAFQVRPQAWARQAAGTCATNPHASPPPSRPCAWAVAGGVLSGLLLQPGAAPRGWRARMQTPTPAFAHAPCLHALPPPQFGPNCTTFLVAGEVFPTGVRSFFSGISAAAGKAGAVAAAAAFPQVSTQTAFYASAGAGLLGFLLTALFLPDTTGLDLHEIDR